VAEVGRLLAAVAAADVLAVDEHPRRELHQDPRVAGRRQTHDLVLGDVDADLSFLGVDDGRLPDDGDRLLEPGLLHGDVECHVLAEGDDELVADDRLEALELELQLVVIGDVEVKEAEIALRGGDDRERRRLRAGQRDADARQGVALLVHDLAPDAAGFLAADKDRHEEENGQ
jgi:hypothetical protein